MKTIVYLIRHAESPYVRGQERSRGLSASGADEAEKIVSALQDEPIDAIFSSPYQRAILTVTPLAKARAKEIHIIEDLHERTLAAEDYVIKPEEFIQTVENVFQNPEHKLPGGESNNEAQARGIAAFLPLLEHYAGKHIAIGSHGNIMTLLLQHFDPSYGNDFWKQLTLPDIYKLTFEYRSLLAVERMYTKGGDELD